MAQFDNLMQVPEEAYHPDRYVDADDTFRARVFALFSMIDRDKDLNLSVHEIEG
jgi:hypothetical protein